MESGLKYKILDDQPWKEGRTDRAYPDDDPLGFQPLARRIARVIHGAEPNLAIGVYGDWGSGKTSFMRMIERFLEGEDHVVTVWFNAWQHHHSASPLLSLATAIDHELQRRNFSRKDSFWSKALDILPEISSLSLAGFIKLDMKREEMDAFAKASAKYAEALAHLHALGRSLSGSRTEEIPRIVVFIDDLDRCTTEVSVRLLESIKLVFGQPGFVFVLGVMPEVIAAHVARGLSITDVGTTGREYLDKIMQLTFRIPSPSVQTTEALVRYLCEELGDEDLAPSVSTFAKILIQAGGTIGTPRAIKRFINEYAMERDAWREAATGSLESPAVAAARPRDADIACALTLRYCWPELFEAARTWPDTILLQLREAANVAGNQTLLSARLGEIAQSVDSEAEAREIKDRRAFRRFLDLSPVTAFLDDLDRAALAIRGPGAELRGAETLSAGRPRVARVTSGATPVETGTEEEAHPGQDFQELAIRFQIEPSVEAAQRALRLVETAPGSLNRTEVGNLAVRVGHAGFTDVARAIFEAMDAGELLHDWRHAGQYVIFLLTRAKDKGKAREVMDRFREQRPFDDARDEERWQLAEALIGGTTDLGGFLDDLKGAPGSEAPMLALLAAITESEPPSADIARQALDALAMFTGPDSVAATRTQLQMVRATGDALGRGSGAVALAGAALFWVLRGTFLWDDFATIHNLANVTWVDIDDDELAVALWTIAYTSGGRTEQQVRRPFSTALQREDMNEAALAVIQGKTLPDEAVHVAAARRDVDAAAWDDDQVVRALEDADGKGPWDGLLAAVAAERLRHAGR